MVFIMASADPYVCTLSPELLKKAKKELNEDPTTRHIEIKTLRERLQKNVPGYKGRLNDGFLLRFLHCKKFNQERAFKMVQAYYNARKLYPEIFDDLTPKRVEDRIKLGYTLPLKQRAPDGSKLVLTRPGRDDGKRRDEGLGYEYLTMSKVLEEEETQINGVTFIVDMTDYGWDLGALFTPSFARKFSNIYLGVLLLRIKGLHFVNKPTFMDILFTILKAFLPKKLVEKTTHYGTDLEKLYEKIPRDVLPVDVGGTLPAVTHDEWTDFMLSCEDQFKRENKFGIMNLTLEVNPKAKEDAIDGLRGSFNNLHLK